jgi:Iron/zinc purple acid phosphatase-like protein C/Fibronectin type III domain
MIRIRKFGRPALGLATAAVAVAALTVVAGRAAAVTSAPPTQPGPIAVSGVTMNGAALSWAASKDPLGIVGYEVYRQETAPTSGPSELIRTTDGGIARYTATHLYASTTYTFSVIALDPAGQKSVARTVDVSTLANPSTTKPAAPADSSVSAKAFSDTRIDVVWGASPPAANDVSGYLVLRDGTQVGRVDLPNGLRYSDNGLTAGTKHTYQIEAVDSAGNVSSPTTALAPASATTLASGTVKIARGPFVSNVTATSAIVSWFTNIATPGIVHYGVGSPSATAPTDPSALQHAVTLSGLTGGTTYQYTVGDGSITPVAGTFRTAAAPGTAFSFAAIGDFGGASPGEQQNATNIAGAGTSFIQTVGDNIYPSAGRPDPNFATTYSDFDARFFKQFGPALRNQAFLPANGNQEYYSDGKFWSTFPMLGSTHQWYGYNWGDAHVTVLDTEQPYTPGTDEYAFVDADLAAHQSDTWRIVVMQAPPYSSVSANSSSKPAEINLVPLFEKYHVQLVLSGNSHNYERSYPLVGGVPTAGGVTYVVTGGGGNGHNAFPATPAPAWSAHRDGVSYEYARVSVSPTAIKVDEVAADNTVADTTTIAAPAGPGMFTAVAPKRLLDTRSGAGTAVPAGGEVRLKVTGGSTGVASGAAAVVLNVTVTQPSRGGHITVFPDGTTMPTASNLNFVAGQTVPNLVVVKVGSNGQVVFHNGSAGSVHLIADLAGFFQGGTAAAPGSFTALAPNRLLDTRSGAGTAVPAGGEVRLKVTGGSTGVASGAAAVVLNVTVTQPSPGRRCRTWSW